MQLTKESREHKNVSLARLFVLENVFQLTQVTSVQIGRGIAKAPANRKDGLRTVILWTTNIDDCCTLTTGSDNNVRCRDIIGEEWPESYCLAADHYSKSPTHVDDCLRDDQFQHTPPPSDAATGSNTEPSIDDRLSTIPEEPNDFENFWMEDDLTPCQIIDKLSPLVSTRRSGLAHRMQPSTQEGESHRSPALA